MKPKAALIKGGIAVDDRGNLRFVNDFHFEGVKRFYQVENYRRGFIRAWHGHEREGKYVWVSCGSALVGVVPLGAERGDLSQVERFVLSDKSPCVLWIPEGHYNGFMTLDENTRVIFFSTASMEETNGDDIRLDYDAWDIWQENFR